MIMTLAALTLLAACTPSADRSDGRKTAPIRVSAIILTKSKVTAPLHYSGTVEAFQTIPLNFKTSGTVESVVVQAGDIVRKGQLLATVDETDAQSMYNITLSQYQQAKDAYDRLKTVHDNGSLPEIKWVEMESKLEQAKSSLDLAKSNLDKCRLTAPADGMIGRRNTEPGMSALSLGSAPLELVDIRQVYVKISVPENEIALLKKGMPARFAVPALGERAFEGRMEVITPVADRISRTYEAKALVANPDLALKPGMVCDMNMERPVEREVFLVPGTCVTMDFDKKAYVFVVDPAKSTASRRQVVTGQYYGDGLEIVSGLQAGERVVSEGKEKLSDGCKISL